jgi:hypothetical protein
METTKLERYVFIKIWNEIKALTEAGVIDSTDAKENLVLNYEESQARMKVIEKIHKELGEKYYEKDKKKLKPGMKEEDYFKELEEYNEGEIEVNYYPIDWSQIREAKIVNVLGNQIPIPAITKINLKPFLMIEENKPKLKEVKKK